MGSSISKIYEDHEDYEYLCKVVGVESLDIRDEWMKHEDEILLLNGVRSKYDLYDLPNPQGIEWVNVIKREKREVTINTLLNDK